MSHKNLVYSLWTYFFTICFNIIICLFRMVSFLLVLNNNFLCISPLSYTCHKLRPFLSDWLHHSKQSPVHVLQPLPYKNQLPHLPSRHTWQWETNYVLCLGHMSWRRAVVSTITDATQESTRQTWIRKKTFPSKRWQQSARQNKLQQFSNTTI
jgi:hypothetical protein